MSDRPFKIAVLSDTHGLLRPEVREAVRGCDAILHAGDVGGREVVEELRACAPVYAVRGNADREPEDGLPETCRVTLAGVRIFLTHKRRDIPADLTDTDLAVFGHSHRFEDEQQGSVRYLNPGSCGPRRFRLPATLAVVTVEEGGLLRVHKTELDGAAALPERDEELLRKDPGKLIRQIAAEVEKGRSVPQIARKLGISRELAESVSRMYLTHPGVDTAGILRRIGR